MRVRESEVLFRCIEDGAIAGVRRAFKHTAKPTQEAIAAEVETAIRGEIYDYFSTEDEAAK